MSLLNNVLRDLQTRGAFGVEPLTGLEPVAEAPTQHRWPALLLSALAALSIASATVLWRPAADGRWLPSIASIMVDADAQPQPGFQTAPKTSPQAEPDVTASGDQSSGAVPVDRTSESSPAPLDDDVVDTAADSPPADFADRYVVQLGAFADPANAAPPQAEPDLAATGDHSSGAFPVDRTSQSSPAPLDDDVANTAADSPSSSAESAVSPVSAVAPATATILRRETVDAATAAARSVTRGLTAMRGNDLPTAERLFREALTIDPGDGAVWSYLYSVLVRASKPGAAEQALRRGLISAKQPAPLAKLYARMLLDRGEKDAAVSMLRTHRPLPATDIVYDAFLAALLHQLGQYTEARDIYRKLLTVEPSTGSWWIGLAMSDESLGNRPEALSAFQRALRTQSLKIPLTRYARRRIAELQAHD